MGRSERLPYPRPRHPSTSRLSGYPSPRPDRSSHDAFLLGTRPDLRECCRVRCQRELVAGMPCLTATRSAATTPAVRVILAAPPPARRITCLLYTSPSPRDGLLSRMPS